MFDDTNELKNKQIKGENHRKDLHEAADFISKKV